MPAIIMELTPLEKEKKRVDEADTLGRELAGPLF